MFINGQITTNDAGEQSIFALVDGQALNAHQSHPNWNAITQKFLAQESDGFADLFDIPQTIERKFARLSERVTAKNGNIYFDGDEVHGTIIEAILGFMEAGEDVGPLVNFFEKLTTNPLGNVQDGLFSWITGQKEEGNFTITPDGDILGYKAVAEARPEWRTDEDVVYVPSRRGEGIVNGRDVSRDEFIEQVPGDVVEMPRSRVLNEPSAACGDGLHIGTWHYAKTFMYSGEVMLVRFSPRDIVSLPDSNSTWKLRVCRYVVVGPVTEPLDVPLYSVDEPLDDGDLDLSLSDAHVAFVAARKRLREAQREVALAEDEDLYTEDEYEAAQDALAEAEDAYDAARAAFEAADGVTITAAEKALDNEVTAAEANLAAANVTFGTGSPVASRAQDRLDEAVARKHGRGGPTSQAAKGRGRNPNQDVLGRFSAGRPGSRRDGSTGRFA
jgi:hypothetical protein